MLLASDVDSPVPLREPAYTATVTLDQNTIEANGMKVSLQPDMVLRADIILERRTLAAWILAPWRHILPSFGNI
jgi:membrane fusion protein